MTAFMKMHGLGNDFIVLDLRHGAPAPGPALIRALADRHFGIGFDQLALIGAKEVGAYPIVFYNADGTTAGACGNASRCIAQFLMREESVARVILRTERGLLACEAAGDETRVNMGAPLLSWQDIPLAHALDTLHLPLPGAPTATGMGNPHCSFFVDDVLAVDLEEEGAFYEHSPLFPARTNVQFAQIIGENHIRMRVWERGVGVTLASGSSSCAVAVAAHRRGLTGRCVRVDLDGGSLLIDWREDGVWMQGEAMHVCDGVLTPGFIADAELRYG